MLVMAEKNF